MDKYNEKLGLKIPAHVAVILDGNGRWAKKKHMPVQYLELPRKSIGELISPFFNRELEAFRRRSRHSYEHFKKVS